MKGRSSRTSGNYEMVVNQGGCTKAVHEQVEDPIFVRVPVLQEGPGFICPVTIQGSKSGGRISHHYDSEGNVSRRPLQIDVADM